MNRSGRRSAAAFALVAAVLAAASAAAAPCAPDKLIKSPDGRQSARIAPADAKVSCDESRVEIRAGGAVIAAKGFGSSDGEKGYGVRTAQWTPDSRFFVFDLESSGGHQPLFSPIYVFDAQARTLEPLKVAANLIPSAFKLQSGDRLALTVWDVSKQASRSVEVALKEAR